MELKWEHLHSEMLMALNRCKAMEGTEAGGAACCYNASLAYWQKVRLEFLTRVMYVDTEEIEFFRNVKPLFTAQVEFYMLVNQALLFLPESKTELPAFWQQEAKRMERFTEKHHEFVGYYKSGAADRDSHLFLRRNNQMEAPSTESFYQDHDLRSSRDHLVRGLRAHQMYQEYVQAKLAELRQPAPGNQ
jgi:hypothetical protein